MRGGEGGANLNLDLAELANKQSGNQYVLQLCLCINSIAALGLLSPLC